jgi:stearoyl-CoA desaturase (Delta-9 desaturase)
VKYFYCGTPEKFKRRRGQNRRLGTGRTRSLMFSRIPFKRVNWLISSFLIGTLLLALTAVPAYIYWFGLDGFQVALFLAMFWACGFSITLGYHRLFSHLAFQAHWSVRLFVLIFGAAAFENSVLLWCCEHRSHHKHVDDPGDDPYCISKGLFFAHMGWLLFSAPTVSSEPCFGLSR